MENVIITKEDVQEIVQSMQITLLSTALFSFL